MSKTERALDSDAAALNELDDFVAAEAEAADLAIGELIDDAVHPPNGRRNGNGHGPAELDDELAETSNGHGGRRDLLDDDLAIGNNGFDTSELELPAEVDSVLDTSEVDITDHGAVHLDGGEVGTPTDVLDELDDFDDVDEDVFELVHLDALVETDEGVVDDEVPEAPYELPEILPATDDLADEPVDDDVDGSPDDDAAPLAAAPVGLTPPVGLAVPVARVGDLDEVSDDILEELRRADIDGPTVDFAPQDDTTSARRRPKRSPDYDPAPIPIPARPPRVLGRKPRVRKVTRVVRHVDPWSVFKIASVAFMVLYVIALTAGVLLWNVAYATGTVDNVERFFESFGWSSFEFNGGEIYHASWIMGLFAVIGLTGMAVLAATLFNLITDIVGGMRFTVLEEEVVETRTSPMRRFVVRRPEPEVPVAIRDGSGAMIREAVVDDSGAIER